ncbi:GerAB/ArcD/ProY family transporter [Paenibacillus silvae]|uniref:Spore gernimation protein n=1 Tax=Paenibacillus silvae TaxID=1325358 RepID=A0A2W6PFJ6_9BACL|nr:GerAB/ArcD/ProY family transporter [Paenibacillus silvae]PZT56886.1 spore gernimation protein [Paenibacillus silvae]
MGKAKISSQQLLALIILFNTGTALVVSLGTKADRDAWLATLLGAAGGMLLFGIYAALYRLAPSLLLTDHLRAVLGRYVGFAAGLLYSVFFLYGASRDLRDGGNLLINSVLDQTPLVVVEVVMILAVAYVLNKGIEVLARTAQIFLMVLLLIGLLSLVLLLCSNLIETKRLFPVLGHGWHHVLMSFLQQTLEFPYSEIICFTMVFPLVNQVNKGIRFGFAAVLISGIVLTLSSMFQITVLGMDVTARSTFPLLYMISLIDIGPFVQRLDVLVVLTLIIGVFFKVAIFYYACVRTIADIFHIPDERKMILPVALLIALTSLISAGSFTEHIEEGNIALRTLFVLLGIIVPVMLLIAGWMKKRMS